MGILTPVGGQRIHKFCSKRTDKFTMGAAHNTYCWGINIAIAHISYTALIVEELINLNTRVSLVSACFASMTSQKGNYTTIMLGELIFNCTHPSYTSTIVEELLMLSVPL